MIIFIFLCFFQLKASASTEDFDIVLDDIITKNGAFNGESGVVYANKLFFSDNESLLIMLFTARFMTILTVFNARIF